MAFALKVPAVGNGQDEMILIRWLKAEGDRVSSGETVVEVELDKGIVGLESSSGGVLLKPVAGEGDILKVGQVIAYIGEPGEALPAGTDHGRSLETGTTGLAGHQKTVARKVSQSLREKPVIHVNASIDMGAGISFMREYQDKNPGSELRYDDLFMFVLGRLLKTFPHFTSYMRGEEIVQYADVNVGFALSIEDQLFIPVIRNADQKEIGVLSREVESMVNKAFDHTLSPSDVSESCIILSNLGMYAIDSFDAIIYPEHSAALAIGSIAPTPVVEEDRVVIRPMAKATLTVDHRLINGKEGAQFLSRLKKRMEKGKFSD